MRSLVGLVLALAAICAALAPKASSQESGTSPAANRIEVSIPIWGNPFAWPQGHGYVGWDKAIDSPNPDGYLLEAGYGDGPGLAIGLNGDMEYRPGGATWSYTAPGTTRIAAVEMNLSYRNKMFAHHCLGVGLRNDAGNRHLVESCNPPEPDSETSYDVALADPSSEPTSKEAFFNVRMPICNNPDDTPCSKWIPSLDLVKNGPLARLHNVDMVLVDDDLPVVTPSGPFFGLNGTYIDGRQSYGLTVDATDAGAGIRRMDIDHLSNPQLANKDAACDPAHHTLAFGSRICPPEDQIDKIVDTNPMPEGTRRFDANAKDPAENVGHAPWTVIIDRTGPPAPSLRFLKPEEGSGQVEWDESVDPILPDGTPGSGTTNYRYRSQINGGNWSDWHEVPASRQTSNEIYDQPIGTTIRFEVRSIDAVGNMSAVVAAESVVDGELPEVTVSGDLADADESYVRGDVVLSAIIEGEDDGVGIQSVALVPRGFGESQAADNVCADAGHVLAPGKKTCSPTFAHQFSLSTAFLGESTYTVDISAKDRANNEIAEPIAFHVDRSAPQPPSALGASFDEDTQVVEVAWTAAEDPPMPSGIDGSGVSHDVYRFAREGESFGEWLSTEDESFEFPSFDGERFRVEVATVDEVGNTSSTTSRELISEDDFANSARVEVHVDDAVGMSSRITPVPGVRVYAWRERAIGGPIVERRISDLRGIATFGKLNAAEPTNFWKFSAAYRNDLLPLSSSQLLLTHGVTYTIRAGRESGITDQWDCWGIWGIRCGKFSRFAARDYALRHGGEGDSNPDYPEYPGTDCTNFLNQILRAGGVSFSGEYDIRQPASEDADAQTRWFLRGSNTKCHPGEGNTCTTSWIRVQAIIDHLIHRRLIRKVRSGNRDSRPKTKTGDLFFFNWEDGNGMDHATFASGVYGNRHLPKLTYHSTHTVDIEWGQFIPRADESDHGTNWKFDQYRVIRNRFNGP